jgi:lysophospholipase L1-like esterase
MNTQKIPRRTPKKRRVPVRYRWSARWMVSFITLSVLIAIVLIGGLVYGSYAAFGGVVGGVPNVESNGGSSTPALASTAAVQLVAIGDSLAHGYGDVSGNGFVGDVRTLYRANKRTVVQSNMGIDGLTSAGLVRELKQPSVGHLLQSASVILVSIGGNDLNDAAGLPHVNVRRVNNAEHAWITNLTTTLSMIRTLNASAPILLVGLYNPYGDVKAVAAATNAIIQSWNQEEIGLAARYSKTVVVQTFDLFQWKPSQYLYIDNFHPNQQGYQRIASRIWQDIQELES